MDIKQLADRVTIVTLSLGMWRPLRLHRAESREETQRHALTGKGARVSLYLSDLPEIEALSKVHGAARTYLDTATLPGCQDGLRLARAADREAISAKLAEFRAQHEALAMRIVAAYPSERDTAPTRLNGLYVAKHWPLTISNTFRFDTKFLPCPAEGQWADWLAESAEMAQVNLREQLRSALSRLSKVDSGAMYASAFAALRHVLAMMPVFDPDMLPPVTAVQAAALARIDAVAIRADDGARKAVATQASTLLDTFGAGSLRQAA